MSKVNAIRKKALDLVRKQDWNGAIKEYRRLAELDQSNPNVFNELGDIYLKTGNKSDAFDSFLRAIDAYTRVSLHNNAVAVCKKVLRLIPSRFEVLTKLGYIRTKQGLGKEAESYYVTYLDKAMAEAGIGPEELDKSTIEIIESLPDSVQLHEKSIALLQANKREEAAGKVLISLYRLHKRAGDNSAAAAIKLRVDELGIGDKLGNVEAKAEGPVITKDNIWTETHSDGDRIDVNADTEEAAPLTEEPAEAEVAATAHAIPDPPAPEATVVESPYEYGNVEMPEEAATATQTTTETVITPPPEPPAGGSPDGDPVPASPPPSPASGSPFVEAPPPSPPPEPSFVEAPSYVQQSDEGEMPDLPGTASAPDEPAPGPSNDEADALHVSAIIDEVASADGEDEDYRSHYDLGMAYLEMELFPEAIREYQFAAKSSNFQIKSLEMIGLCFLKQNQANLAIKQLEKGLSLVGGNALEALGIKYNLGLAYELASDFEKAKGQFEDVYVTDVTFRDVAAKIEKYS